MSTDSQSQKRYALGHDPEELARLEWQAAFIAPATRLILREAGIRAGMRVLDLGTGLGHVARLASELVGPAGAVVGVDRSVEALAVARARASDAGETEMSFVDGDVTGWRAPQPFDAIVTRLLLFHVADPVAVVRHHLSNLLPGGLFVAIDYDIGGARSEPPIPLLQQALDWIERAFRAAGASPRIGSRLAPILDQAGLRNVTSFGVQGYVPPHDRAAAILIHGVLRALAPVVVQHGIATAEELDVATLEDRIVAEAQRAQAVVLPPTVVGAWGSRQ